MTTPGEPQPASPGSLILTFAGLHLRQAGGWIAVADLIDLLGSAGVAPTAVRQAVLRLKSRGVLASTSRDGRAGYRLTAGGLEDLAAGDARIFRYGEAAESDGWVLAVFSVPESARAERHRLRSQLSWLGFGTVSPGVWIAPAALAERAAAAIEREQLDHFVTWFTGQPAGPAQVAAWWDLATLGRLYEQFLTRWEPLVRSPSGSGVSECSNAADAFAQDLLLVDSWRQFPRIDPGLPAALLPPGWPGRRAFEVFAELRGRWSGPARAHASARLERLVTGG